MNGTSKRMLKVTAVVKVRVQAKLEIEGARFPDAISSPEFLEARGSLSSLAQPGMECFTSDPSLQRQAMMHRQFCYFCATHQSVDGRLSRHVIRNSIQVHSLGSSQRRTYSTSAPSSRKE